MADAFVGVFGLFLELGTEFVLDEVFPSAYYSMVRSDLTLISLHLGELAPPKDILDA
jgi:hypothetical protein